MTDKQKIAELERRVKDLETSRPLIQFIPIPYIIPVTTPVPRPWWDQPWNPTYVGDPLPGHFPTITSGSTS